MPGPASEHARDERRQVAGVRTGSTKQAHGAHARSRPITGQAAAKLNSPSASTSPGRPSQPGPERRQRWTSPMPSLCRACWVTQGGPPWHRSARRSGAQRRSGAGGSHGTARWSPAAHRGTAEPRRPSRRSRAPAAVAATLAWHDQRGPERSVTRRGRACARWRAAAVSGRRVGSASADRRTAVLRAFEGRFRRPLLTLLPPSPTPPI